MKSWIASGIMLLACTMSSSAFAITCEEIEDANKEIAWNKDKINEAQAAINALSATKAEKQKLADEEFSHVSTTEDAIAKFNALATDLQNLITSKYKLDQIINYDQTTREMLAEVIESEFRSGQDVPQLAKIMLDLKGRGAPEDMNKSLYTYLSGLKMLDKVGDPEGYFNLAISALRTPQSPQSLEFSKFLSKDMSREYDKIQNDKKTFVDHIGDQRYRLEKVNEELNGLTGQIEELNRGIQIRSASIQSYIGFIGGQRCALRGGFMSGRSFGGAY